MLQGDRDCPNPPVLKLLTYYNYIDDYKIFAASESKLHRIMDMVKTTMKYVALAWNPKKCAVVHVRVHVSVTWG